MGRLSYVFPHVALATSIASGAASAGLRVGSFESGQMIIYRPSAGVGAWIRFYWQSSSDGVRWGDWLSTATLTAATGVSILSADGGIGVWARMRWRQSPTANRFQVDAVFKE
jgi:hypothetical protein